MSLYRAHKGFHLHINRKATATAHWWIVISHDNQARIKCHFFLDCVCFFPLATNRLIASLDWRMASPMFCHWWVFSNIRLQFCIEDCCIFLWVLLCFVFNFLLLSSLSIFWADAPGILSGILFCLAQDRLIWLPRDSPYTTLTLLLIFVGGIVCVKGGWGGIVGDENHFTK